MAIARDTNSTVVTAASPNTTVTTTLTTGVISNGILFTMCVSQAAGGAGNQTGATANGTAMVKYAERYDATNNYDIVIWMLNNAVASTAYTCVVTRSTTTGSMISQSVSYSGASPSNAPDASASVRPTSGTSVSQTLTTLASNCWIISIGDGATPLTQGTNFTFLGTGLDDAFGDSNGAVASGANTVTYTSNGSGGGLLSASFAPVGGIAWDRQATVVETNNGSGIATESFTIASGATLYVNFLGFKNGASNSDTLTSMVYGSTTLTVLSSSSNVAGDRWFYTLVGIGVGNGSSQTLTITSTKTGTPSNGEGAVLQRSSYLNVGSTGAKTNTASGSSANTYAIALTGITQTTSWVVGAFQHNGAAVISAGTGTTMRTNDATFSNEGIADSNNGVGGTSYTLNANYTISQTNEAAIVELVQSVPASPAHGAFLLNMLA